MAHSSQLWTFSHSCIELNRREVPRVFEMSMHTLGLEPTAVAICIISHGNIATAKFEEKNGPRTCIYT